MSANPAQPRFGCYIGNIDRSVTLEMLKQVFCQCGTIIDCSLNGREEDPYRYGFIDFATEDDRARAMKYNGYTLVGRKLKVGVSKGNVNKPEGYNNTNTNNSTTNRGGVNLGGTGVGTGRVGVGMNTAGAGGSGIGAGIGTAPSALQTGAAAGGNAASGGGLAPAQQMEAQLLLQLIQQGSLDTANLTESQRALLLAVLPNTGAAVGAAAAAAAIPMQPMNLLQPPLFGAPMWGAMMGMPSQGMMPMNPAMMAAGRSGNAAGFHRGPANPSPSEETLKLREIQRKQFLKVIREETEAYEKKLQERSAKEGRLSGGSDDGEGSSGSESDSGKPLKRRRADKSGGGISDEGGEDEAETSRKD
ncbi:unnamed protein product [Phytomonas sp. Hart1]|nr:unnamed protein product [Phytomonas sp. Hart1]|eukprot:CCW69135.1 unnamed protein product [Phytomonas sp. isolate Hart1]